MGYKTTDTCYKPISPGTMGVAQKISSSYRSAEVEELGNESSRLVLLTKNDIMACGHNQF